ncbi:MAG: adenosylmethionine--8-amino-7-oxononanoate transaminase [Pseudomonadota bacterium]
MNSDGGKMVTESLTTRDRRHVWHPYSAIGSALPLFEVASARGVRLTLTDGRELIDGMSSWWSAIHGYNVPALNAAAEAQIARISHVMFGGLTHEPAVRLAERLVELAPKGLETVFLADSGSVAVEVALKMALQYAVASGRPERRQVLALRGGYHGDTFGAMSVCDPVTGMHTLFAGTLAPQLFAPRPTCRFDAPWDPADTRALETLLSTHRETLAAVILEPIVQGAGGMWFYHPAYLREVRRLCDAYGLLLIADEIATGFGRTGKLFACEHAAVAPDILCVGKALTGGFMTLAATLATRKVAETIASVPPGVFMHGPTFMGNPLACAVANASLDLLLAGPWQARIAELEQGLRRGLAPCRELPGVADVRVLGAIGVVEMQEAVDMRTLPHAFVERGVWVRPFGRLVYVMPPFVMEAPDLALLTAAIVDVLQHTAHP